MPTSTQDLINDSLWDDVRKRLKRIKKNETVASLFEQCAVNPTVPEDIMDTLASKIEGKGYMVNDSFHQIYVAKCLHEYFFISRLTFHRICANSSVSSFDIVLKVFLKDDGAIFPQLDALRYIRTIWSGFLRQHRRVVGSQKMDWDVLVPKLSSHEDLHSDSSGLFAAWQKTELLIRATQRDSMSKSREELQLVRLMIQLGVNKTLVWLALRLFPAQAKLRDSLGRIPLHWATIHCENPNFNQGFSSNLLTGSTAENLSGWDIVEVVLDAFPSGAGYQDAQGSHPLVYLLNLKYDVHIDQRKRMRIALAMAEKAPQALSLTNQHNHMLPFMTAACEIPSSTYTNGDRDKVMLHKLNLTFGLLMADPTVVTRGIKVTDREIWLTEKLDKAQCHIQALQEENRKLREQMEKISQRNDVTEIPRVAPIELYNLAGTRPTPAPKRQKVSHPPASAKPAPS